MNKQRIQNVLLALLPAMAVAVASSRNSVAVRIVDSGKSLTGSYFDLMPVDSALQILPPLAAMTACACMILAVLYLIFRKEQLANVIMWLALISACAATIPLVANTNLAFVPNLLLPLLMCAEAWLTFTMTKKDNTQTINTGRRLEKR